MTDASNKKLTILMVLVGTLLVAVIVQSLVMLGMHRQLQGASERKRMDRPAIVQKDGPKADSPPSLLQDPFDWKLDDWDPFKEMESMHDRIDQMFGSAFNRFQHSDDFKSLFSEHSFSPAINMEDKGDHYEVTVDLPGSEDSRLDVKLEGQTLTISGTVQSEIQDKNKGKMLRQERRSGKFHRTVTLPSPVQADKMTSENKKGVLCIRIPKAAKVP